MIIKKKYTNVKKLIDEIRENSVPEVEPVEVQKPVEVVVEEIEKEETQPKNNDDFDLSLENIKFEPREERREGSRRRGYRRSADRNLVSRAQAEAVSIREAAKQEGYQEGIKQVSKDIEDLRAKLEEFFNYKEEVYEKVSDCIMDIAVEIAKKNY